MFANSPSSYDRRYSQVNNEYTEDLSSYSGHPWYPNSTTQHSTHVVPAYELREQQAPAQSFVTQFMAPWPRKPGTNYSAVQQVHEISQADGSPPGTAGGRKLNTGYNPLFTRKWILWCFALLWLLIIASLQVIYSVSEAQKGLATTNISLRYLWTYGPTAFLVVVTVVWRQVDYAAKYVQPWAELAKGPLPASRTLLLDYTTPFQAVAFWRAIRLRHVTVFSTILIFVLIKASTVISTGLLNLEIIPFESVPHPVRITSVFDGSRSLDVTDIDARAAVGLYGHREYNMLLPNGTTEMYAFQLFEPATDLPNDTYAYSASVDVFVADGWECETGLLTYQTGRDHSDVGDGFGFENTPVANYYNASISLPDCEISKVHLDAPSWYWLQNDTTPRYGYWGAFQHVNCSNLDPSDPKFDRFTVSVAYSVGTGQNDHEMLNSSNAVCIPSYKIQKGNVSIFKNGTVDDHIVLTGEPRQLKGKTAIDIALATEFATRQAIIPLDINAYNITAQAFLNNMISSTPDFEWEMLMNNTWLYEKSRKSFQQFAAQIAGIYLLRPVEDPLEIEGLISRDESRLMVRELPTRLMQVCVAVMLFLTMLMIFTMPQSFVPRPIGSVGAIAAILTRSPSLVELLKNTGHLDLDQLKCILDGHRYMSRIVDTPHSRTFSISVSAGSRYSRPPATNTEIKWFQPLVLRRVVLALTLLLAICVLAALEVLVRRSRANNGIGDVDVNSLQKYSWLYIPTIVLVLLATNFNILDFEIKFSNPYHELARGYSNAHTTLLWDPLGNITPKTCLEAFKNSRFALVASSIAVLFAPLLTIVASGLFAPRSVAVEQTVSAQALTWFNGSSYSGMLSSEVDSFRIPALILQGNMSYPQWTYDEFAFPEIDLSSKGTGIANGTDGIMSIVMPAARATVTSCTIAPSEWSNFTFSRSCNFGACLSWNLSLPDGCLGTSSLVRSISGPPSGSGYFGAFLVQDLLVKQRSNDTVTCPQLQVIYGTIRDYVVQDFNLYRCYSGIETVDVNATISVNLATIIDRPTVLENTARTLNKTWWPDQYNAPSLSKINFTHADEGFADLSGSFINGMVYGKDGVPREELLDPDTFQRQFTHTYRQWVAQWMNTYMRNPVDKLPSSQSNVLGPLTAIYRGENQQRLFLVEVSTRILQGVVSLLIICGIVIFVLIDMSNVLPKPIGTIAAVASLLAGSRLVDERTGLVPPGSEWMTDGDMKRKRIWEGDQFKMEWWVDDADFWGHNAAKTEYKAQGGGGQGIAHFKLDMRPRSGVPVH